MASDGEAPLLVIQGMWSIFLLPLLPGPLWPSMVIPVRISLIGLIELFNHLLRNIIIIIIIITWNHPIVCKSFVLSFGSVSLFNGISTFVSYLMLKPSL